MIKIYKKLISYAPEKKYLLVMTIIFSVGSAIFQIFSFYYLHKFLLKIISNSEMDYLMNSAVKVVSFMFCGALLYFLSLLVSHLFAFRLETNLRKYGIDGLSKASFKFFDMNSSGVIRKQIDDNAAQTHTAVAHLIPDNIGATLMPFFIIVLGFFISLRVGLIMLFLAIVSCILFSFMVGNKEFMKIYLSAMDKLSSETVEYIRGIQVIKIFGIDVRSFKQLNEAIKNYAQYSLAYAHTCRIPWVLFQEMFLGIVAILIPLIINFTDYKVDSCQTLTELIMIFFLSGVMFSYVYKVMNLSMYLYKAQDSVNKLENLYENMRSNSLVFGDEIKFDNYDIEFKNVSFGYTDKMILNNLSFKLQEGKKYALVGSSGSGKSTIVKLISGFYKANEGTIEIARTMSSLPLSYFSKHDLSDLSQTIMSDVSGLEHALSHAICQYIGYLFFFAISSVMMLIGNFKLGLVVIIPILLNYFLLYLSKKFEFINNSEYYNKLRQNSDEFQETIEMQQEIKSLGLGEEIKNKLSKDMEESEKIHINTELKSAIILNLAGISLYLSLVGILTFGVNMLINKEINLLFFIGYLLAAMKFKEGSENISQNIAEIFVIDDMVNRINEIRNTPIQEGADAKLDNFDILFNNVGFSYDKNTKVLDNINFTAKQGQITALVGKSGCGKTSILRLISRLYDYDNGLIEISGKDIKEISTNSLFENISIVFQDVTLFNSTILDNIRIGNINASDEDVIKAAKMANCEEFINRLPEKYNTLISENGNALSGGERQRISIARAFLKNAPIIILDEISASLDIENEKIIQESLNKLIKNKTVIIISHRLKSIEKVDKIVVMEDGKIESVGTNKELLEKSKAYNNLILNNQMVENFVYE